MPKNLSNSSNPLNEFCIFTSLREVIFTTAGAEVSTNSEILEGNAALVNDANPSINKRTILFVKRFMLFPLIN